MNVNDIHTNISLLSYYQRRDILIFTRLLQWWVFPCGQYLGVPLKHYRKHNTLNDHECEDLKW